ncbi:MAG: Fur family transcriptional regulator [Planctomycetaceae bacterium]
MSEQADEIQEVRQILRDHGFRATPARIAVLQQLRNATSPLTHADLSETLVPVGFDKATVFRNLTDLTEAGLVSRTELGDHVWRFEILDPNDDGEKHPHFVCTDCGDVSCLGAMNFTANSRQKASIIGRISEILIKGLCAKCESGAA